MGEKHIDVTVESAADAATIYALLRSGATWPTWSPITSFELESPADDEPEGLGAIRLFRTKQVIGETQSHERIVELVPDRRFSYALLAGLPLRNYRADVDLTPLPGGGTRIRWHSSFTPGRPGTGWLYRAVLAAFIGRCARGLAVYAVRSAGAGTRTAPPEPGGSPRSSRRAG
jgi:hypothetical protein